MNLEAATAEVLALMVGEGKQYLRLEPLVRERLARVLGEMIDADTVANLSTRRGLHLKSFDDHYQVNIDGEKRVWFTEQGDTLLITHIGSTDHRHGRKR